MQKQTVTIPLEEYKELLIIKGRYEENKKVEEVDTSYVKHWWGSTSDIYRGWETSSCTLDGK